MKQQILNAVADMKTKVVMTDGHRYLDNQTGLYIQGVSSVSSIVPKDWLSAWGAKEAVKALGFSDYPGDTILAEQVFKKIKECSTIKEYLAILKEAKGAHARKSKKAMVDGTKGHAWLEDFVKAQANLTPKPTLPTNELSRPIMQFLKWESENVKEWIVSEALVCYPEHSYAGTLDAIAILKTNELALIDFKFASNISIEYRLQTAGYAACFEPYNVKFDHRIIIRLPKTLEKDEWDPKSFTYKKIPNDIEVQVVPTKYETDRDAFIHALSLKSWINSLDNTS